MTSAACCSSAMRTACRSARTSGLSIAGLRMSPSSPPVQHTSTVRTPSAWYLATVPAPLEDSSSGWAWTVSRQRRSSAITVTLTGVARRSFLRELAPLAVPTPHEDAAEQGHDHRSREHEQTQVVPDEGPV